MTIEEIQKNNQLIAEFMGWYKKEYPSHINSPFHGRDIWFMKTGYNCGQSVCEAGKEFFHNSWEWLMEVVNKINSFEENGVFTYGVIIAPEACVIERPTQYGNIENEHGATLIEMVYLTIVEFIEWYNKEVKK